MGKQWLDGDYEVVNKEKYIGEKPPHYRSSWELRMIQWLDQSPNVKRWSSENIMIPYLFEIDKQVHKYFPDIYFEAIDKNNNLKKFLIEIKPDKQKKPPKPPKNKNQKALKNYAMEVKTFIKNQNKWSAAKNFCKDRGIEFLIISEQQIFTT
jgi:hypothetical protein